MISIDRPGQEILERTSAFVNAPTFTWFLYSSMAEAE